MEDGQKKSESQNKDKLNSSSHSPTKDGGSGKENEDETLKSNVAIGQNEKSSKDEVPVKVSEDTKTKKHETVEKAVKKDESAENSVKVSLKSSDEKREEKQHSVSNKSSDHSSHRSKHKHHHRDRSGSKSSSSEHRSQKQDHNKSESSSKESKSSEGSLHKSDTKAKIDQVHKSSEAQTLGDGAKKPRTEKPDFKTDTKDHKSDLKESKTGQNSGKSEHKSQSSDSHSKSSSGSTDKSRSHHRKKRIVNCGVQVNLKRKTDTKAAQVPDDNEHENNDKNLSSLKISEKKLQRIAYVQQSISSSQKYMKQSKVTPKKQQSVESNVEAAEHEFSEDFSTESQDNRMWKTHVASVEKYKFKDLMHVEQYSNGGGLVLHAYQNEVSKLSKEEQAEFAKEFMDFCYGEPREGVANCVMGIVHEAISHWPDLVEHMADTYPNLTVKAGVLGKSDIDTMTMEKFREQVHKSFQAGTFRCGPLLQVSLVGTAQEEVGDYFPEILDLFESDPFLNLVMPWGELSSVRMASRNMSNDGPILWTRPGEQLIPTADMPKSPFKRKR